MKIGILTFHDTTNFGSLLQTYGLYRAIENLGGECEVIDYQCEEIMRREIPLPFEFSFNPKKLAKELLITRKQRIKYKELTRFLHNNMKLSPRYSRSDICLCEEKYDKILIGSDIVWGLDITNADMTYFLDFVGDNSKKYAFSASIGTGWSKEEKNLLTPLLADFKSIAVREEQAVEWVSQAGRDDARLVCDPTMLVDAKIWSEFASDMGKDEKYVAVYFDTPDHECINRAKQIAAEKGLKVKFINHGLPQKGVDNVSVLALEDFLGLIKNAEYVVTASYHGLLFALYFQREVIYFNRAHKSRMESLASRLGIGNCNGKVCDGIPKVDYPRVNKNISDFRQQSLTILKEMLND